MHETLHKNVIISVKNIELSGHFSKTVVPVTDCKIPC